MAGPAEYVLRDGTRVRLRPIRADDKERLAQGVARLSSRSRYFRFLGAVASLTDTALRYLTEVDQASHIAWVAVEPTPEERLLGVARCVRVAGEPLVAEVALVVADELQNHGLGSLLFEVLAREAARHGIATLRASVLRENTTVVHALQELGLRGAVEDGLLHVDVPLEEAAALAKAWNDARPAS